MRVQEQAFRAYYASMTDADPLKTAANRASFIALAEQVLAEEMARRNLALPTAAEPPPASGFLRGLFHRAGQG